MKKFIQSLLVYQLPCLLLCLFSCNSLEEEPQDFLSPNNYFNNAAEADAVLIGAYNKLTNWDYYGRAFYNIVGLASDDEIVGNYNTPRRVEIDFFTLGPDNGEIPKVWNQGYESILACNMVLDQLPNIDDNAEQLAQIEGQALFIRALNYFNLVRIYGAVPLVTGSNLDLQSVGDKSRDPIEAVYAQIEMDLEMAEDKLPLRWADSEVGRATRGAAKTLFSKVLLTEKKWPEAAAKAKEVIDLNEYILIPDYADLWLVANENGPEHIFSIQSKALVNVPGRLTLQLLPISAGGNGNVLPEVDLFNTFSDEDYRKEISFMTRFTDDDGNVVPYQEWSVPQPHIGKYKDAGEPNNLSGGDTNTNWPVFRYAEVLLIYAEALNEANGGPTPEAYEAINQIRTRAQLANIQPGLDQLTFRKAVLDERRFELCFEGKRWFDLVRWDMMVETLSESRPNVKEFHQLFPIPLSEIDVSGGALEQNPGYN
ncbi:MAG: RagB/SusD family nutrient uptake outer membrane protein [Cyclobacteriaceae bacterium]